MHFKEPVLSASEERLQQMYVDSNQGPLDTILFDPFGVTI